MSGGYTPIAKRLMPEYVPEDRKEVSAGRGQESLQIQAPSHTLIGSEVMTESIVLRKILLILP